jgi:hypothetical protein
MNASTDCVGGIEKTLRVARCRLNMNLSTDSVGGIVRLKARAVREVEVLSR